MFCLTWLAHYLVTVPQIVTYGWMERFGAQRAGGKVLHEPASSKVIGACIPHPLFLRLMTGINKGNECDHNAKPSGINKH